MNKSKFLAFVLMLLSLQSAYAQTEKATKKEEISDKDVILEEKSDNDAQLKEITDKDLQMEVKSDNDSTATHNIRAAIGMQYEGTMPRRKMAGQTKVMAINFTQLEEKGDLAETDYHTIDSFTLEIFSPEGESLFKQHAEGARFTVDMRKRLARVYPGYKVIVSEVMSTGPGGLSERIPDSEFVISE